jgi:hypothetical protein
VAFIEAALAAAKPGYQGPPASGDGLLAWLSFEFFILPVVWIVHLVSRLRTARSAYVASGTVHLPVGRDGAVTRARIAPALFVLTTAGMCVFSAITAAQFHAEAAQSAYVQQQGLTEVATVTRVHNSAHQSGTYGALITVTLTHPVDGQATTIVHDPARSGLVRGLTLEVLVDPRDPHYAELPGVPYFRASGWIALTIFAALTLLIGAGFVAFAFHIRRRSRRSHTGAPARHAA